MTDAAIRQAERKYSETGDPNDLAHYDALLVRAGHPDRRELSRRLVRAVVRVRSRPARADLPSWVRNGLALVRQVYVAEMFLDPLDDARTRLVTALQHRAPHLLDAYARVCKSDA